MTTPARQAEADRVAAAYQVALTQIGAKTVADALVLWEDMPPTARASTAATWLRAATRLILSRRRHSRELARAYYRLARALHTGTTVANPYDPEPTYITIDVLRSQFEALANPSAPQVGAEGTPAAEPEQAAEVDPGTARDEELDRILVEELEGLREEEERLEREAEQEIQTALDALGPKNLERKLRDLDTSAPADEVDELRREAHKQAGARQAAAAERMAMNGGRSETWTLQEKDPKALGYARVSQTGTPCGWCAMLISRGAVYKSERTATLAKNAAGYVDGDKYHDNCHCIAVPVFSLDEYERSAKFALNRKYAQQWPQVTRGLAGKHAVSAWRRFIRTDKS